MGRRRKSRELGVAVNGRELGVLKRVSRAHLEFRYAEEWLGSERAHPLSLSMPLSPDPYSGDVVWNWFDNLLPDNPDLRGRMVSALGAESTRPFDLLAAAGRDCVGAVQLGEPGELPDVRRIEATPVSNEWIGERLRSYATRPLGMSEGEDFRISIAGAQEKTALLWLDGAWHRPGGATPTSHIFKLPIGPAQGGIDLSDSVENEWLCLRLASAFGLPVPEARMAEFDGARVLVVERFDRRWSSDGSWLMRLPQEDVCQALGEPARKKYESDGGPGVAAILDLLLQSTDPEADRRTFFRALVVYWMLAAIDGHAKNYSLFLLPEGRSRLAPLYDVLSAHPVVARKQLAERELKMAMALDGKNRHYGWRELRADHWLSTARRARFPEGDARALLEECHSRAAAVVDEVSAELPAGFPSEVSDPILDGVARAGRSLG